MRAYNCKGNLDKLKWSLKFNLQLVPGSYICMWCFISCLLIKVVTKVHKAALGYQAWKSIHAPSYKPWLWPEQSILPKLRPDDVQSVGSESPSASDQEQEVIGDDPNGYASSDDDNIMLWQWNWNSKFNCQIIWDYKATDFLAVNIIFA